jgi:DNA ligase (NAD+)
MASIEKSRNVKLENAINALGIDNIGIKASKDIAKFCEYNWHNFIDPIYYTRFRNIEGFGEVTQIAIIRYMEKNRNYVNDLFSLFNFTDTPSTISTNNFINHKTFVITGKLNHYKNRDELVSVIESNGGKVASSVSIKTDYLINNDINSNSGKNKKAKELDIPIITEEDFMKMMAVFGVNLAQNIDFVGETVVSIKDLETRGMIEHERKVYDDMLKNGTVKTGRKLF